MQARIDETPMKSDSLKNNISSRFFSSLVIFLFFETSTQYVAYRSLRREYVLPCHDLSFFRVNFFHVFLCFTIKISIR